MALHPNLEAESYIQTIENELKEIFPNAQCARDAHYPTKVICTDPNNADDKLIITILFGGNVWIQKFGRFEGLFLDDVKDSLEQIVRSKQASIWNNLAGGRHRRSYRKRPAGSRRRPTRRHRK